MNRIKYTGFALLALCMASFAEAKPEKPNLVFIIADDCTFRDIGCYGGQAYTPHIDALAKEGMQMMHCFQTAAMCSPTRHTIYTGLYPVKSGAYPNHTFVRDEVKSVVHYLEPLGYRVALSGKTHISPKENFPFEYSKAKGKGSNPDMEVIDQLMTESIADGNPFCLFACSNEPHTPWNLGDASRYPPEEVKLPPYILDTPRTRSDFSNYLAEVTYFDWQVGEILGLLDKHGIADNTLVIVVSEQGNAFPFAKWTCYDNGLQAAMIARWPGKIEAGSVSEAFVEYVDVTPTFLDAAGGKKAAGLDGRSMLPVLEGKKSSHKKYVYGLQTTRGINHGSPHYGIRSVRGERYKLIHNLDPNARFQNAATNMPLYKEWVAAAAAGDTKAKHLVERYENRPEFEFYDTAKDPLEMNNLYGNSEHEEIVKKLKKELASWMKDQGDLGQETELAAYDRMKNGAERKANIEKQNAAKN
ncbi:MAG: sulfatase [Verrucomicrobiota bacterium]